MKSVSACLCLAAFLAIAACDRGLTAPLVDEDKTPRVTVTPASLNLSAGESATLTAVVENDTTGELSGVVWTSSAPAVASVGVGTGVVTAHAPGNATIIATSRFASTRTAPVEVRVTLPNGTEGMLLTPSNSVVPVGGTITLIASGAAGGFLWSTSAPGVATVSETGEVKAIAPGAALIKAVSRQDTSRFVIATVTVPFPQSFALNILGIGLVPERLTGELAMKGEFAYTATVGFRGFEGVTSFGNVIKVWNVAGLVPALVDSLKIAGITTVSDVQVSPDGSLLVASTEGAGGVGSIVIYSLVNAAKPALISVYRTPSIERGVHTVDLSVVNGKLYGFLQVDPGNKSQPAAEVIVDLSDPTNAQMVFERAMGTPYVHDVFVRDGLLFTALWNEGMTIFDIGGGGRGGSPANPIEISNIRTRSGQIHNVWWYHDPGGDKRYVFLGEEGLGFGVIGQGATSSGDIHVIDISTITAPREVAVYTLGSNNGTHNFSMDERSGILYAAYYNGGVRAIDVRGDLGTCQPSQRAPYTSISGAPLCDLRKIGREVATGAATGGFYIWGVEWQGDRLYASDMGKGLVVLDVSKLRR